MKILLIHNYYRQRGGEDIYFNSLAKLLQQKGEQVVLFTKKSEKISSIKQKSEAIRSLFGMNKKVNKELDDLIKKEKPNIAHFHNIYPLIGPSAYFVCKKNNLPVVQTIHNYRFLPDKEGSFGYQYQNFFYGFLVRLSNRFNLKNDVFSQIDYFIFPSQFTKEVFLKNARFTIKNCAVIPHFVDIKKTDKTVKKSDYFLYAGRFSREKGILPLLKIFSKMPKKKLIVIGDGPQKNQVLKFRKFSNINILPWMEKNKVYQYIKKAKAVIFPSLSLEVMPLTVIESLALGTKVIVPDRGVFPELIKNKQDYSPKKHYSSLMSVYKKLI